MSFRRADLPSRRRERLALIGFLVWLNTALSGCSELDVAPVLDLDVVPIAWPSEILIGDTVTLQVELRDPELRAVVDSLEWHVSPADMIEILEVPDGSNGVAGDRRIVRAVGLQTGDAEISVAIREGAFRSEGHRQAMPIHMQWKSISAGYDHACAVTWDGVPYCWGSIGVLFGGLLGDGSSAGSQVPSRVVGNLVFDVVSAGDGHSCGLVTGGRVFCWGLNIWGAVGNGTNVDQLSPDGVAQGPSWSRVSAGGGHTCGVSFVETGVCFGLNSDSQLGSSVADSQCGGRRCSTVPVASRTPDRILTGFVGISAGEGSTCGVLASGEALCWGDNANGTLGVAGLAASDTAVTVSGDVRFTDVSVGRFHTCGVGEDQRVFCWGTNRFGALGLGTKPLSETCGADPCTTIPMPVESSLPFLSVSVRDRNTCAITTDGRGYCWGLNDFGQLGVAATDTCNGEPCAKAPVEVEGLRFRSISAGARFACGLTPGGAAYCWGRGEHGELGSNSLNSVDTPTRVSDP